LSVGRGRAIDLVAAYELLAPLESVRSRAVLMASHGIDLVLPRRSFSRVTVKRVFESVDNPWRRCDVGMVSFATLVGTDD